MINMPLMIKNAIGENLGLHDTAKNLLKDDMVVDFTDVKFMCRAFCDDEYLNEKRKLTNVIEINIPEEVQKMLDMVEKRKSLIESNIFPNKSVASAFLDNYSIDINTLE